MNDVLRALAVPVLASLLYGCLESADPPATEARAWDYYRSADLPPESDRTFAAFDHVGLIKPDMPVARIENLYGSDALQSRTLRGGEETESPGYVLFPDTYDELEIALGEDKQPDQVSFSHPRSRWHHAETGLAIGTELHELREMNGEPFTFTGFGWDSAGTVTDWNGGALADILVRLTYAPERVTGGNLPDTLLGDRRLSSDSSYAAGLGLRVREIVVPLR